MTLIPPCYETYDSAKGNGMPDYRLTFRGEMVGRVNMPDEFTKTVANVMLSGGRFELSAAFEKAGNQPRLVEFVLSPMPLPEPPEAK